MLRALCPPSPLRRRETDMPRRRNCHTMGTKMLPTKRISAWSALSLAAALLAGCMVGPNYHRPAVQTPTSFRDLSDNPQAQAKAASYADLPWWQVFQDPQLQELIRIAIKQNYDLQLATERINAARDQVAISRSSLFPQVSANGNFVGGREGTFQTKYNFFTSRADAAFQLDFFGKLRRATEASRAQLLATEDARQTVILTLVSDVASDYFTLLQLDLELQITRETVATQQDSVKLTNLPPSLTCSRHSKLSTPPMPSFPTSRGKSHRKKMPSAFFSATTLRLSPAESLSSNSRCLPKCRPACHRPYSSAGPTFARPSKSSSLQMRKSASQRRNFFHKSR
jgi:hypothetical protein